MTPEMPNLKPQLLRRPQIVLIEEREELTAGDFDRMVTRGCDTLICLTYVTHLRKALRDKATIVDRAIVNNDHFKTTISLRKDTLQRLTDVTCTVIDRDNYTRSEERRVGKECRSRWS